MYEYIYGGGESCSLSRRDERWVGQGVYKGIIYIHVIADMYTCIHWYMYTEREAQKNGFLAKSIRNWACSIVQRREMRCSMCVQKYLHIDTWE